MPDDPLIETLVGVRKLLVHLEGHLDRAADGKDVSEVGRAWVRAVQFVGEAPLGTGMTGYSVGTAFTTYHFQVDATGNAPGNALAQHTQSFYIVGPGGS